LLDRLERTLCGCNAVLVSDYAYGTITDAVLRRLQCHEPPLLVVDARSLRRYRALSPTAVKPNLTEALSLLGINQQLGRVEQLRCVTSSADRLLEESGASICAVTLDVDGALVFERGRPAYRAHARPSPNSRSTGAGDTFAAALCLALAADAETPAAVEFASAAAQNVIDREGTVACAAEDLRDEHEQRLVSR
jgi:D-beta-D-heptose 7-phosphate kinase/D-beta-D-heptose 1-phosphate adenosyltransferase